MLCKVKIREVRETVVFVDVDYDFQAESKAEELYNDGIVACYTDDVTDVYFKLEDYDECD